MTIDAINEYYTKYSSNPHSDNRLAVIVYKEIEETRKTLAKFIQADKEEVMFTSGATESINTIANAMQDILKKDDEVIITYMEHSANLLP
ncbi:aminotransferase class V-fold PLP-dependent enzyme [bacterium]|nr:aminotransferase class V-fold PLP-dependent enzyme [bacterium]